MFLILTLRERKSRVDRNNVLALIFKKIPTV